LDFKLAFLFFECPFFIFQLLCDAFQFFLFDHDFFVYSILQPFDLFFTLIQCYLPLSKLVLLLTQTLHLFQFQIGFSLFLQNCFFFLSEHRYLLCEKLLFFLDFILKVLPFIT